MTTKQETNREIPEYTKTYGDEEDTLKAQKTNGQKCEFNALPNNNYSEFRYMTHIQSKKKVIQFASQIAKEEFWQKHMV